MNLNPKILQDNSKLLLFSLIAIDLCFGLIYLISSIIRGEALPAFDFDKPRTIPIFYAALQLFAIGFSLVMTWLWRRLHSKRPYRWILLTVGTGFLYLSIDKILKLHLMIHSFSWLPQFKSGGGAWVFFYVPLGLIIILSGYRDLIALWRFYPRATLITILGVGIFLLGGIGVEVINYQFLQSKIWKIQEQDTSLAIIINAIKVTLEETVELLGQSAAIYGISLFWIKKQLVRRAPNLRSQ